MLKCPHCGGTVYYEGIVTLECYTAECVNWWGHRTFKDVEKKSKPKPKPGLSPDEVLIDWAITYLEKP